MFAANSSLPMVPVGIIAMIGHGIGVSLFAANW
jgi:hypothetical protein